MCIIPPENMYTLQVFGTITLVAGIISYFTKVTYWRGLIRHDEHPKTYWFITIWLLSMGGFIWGAWLFC